jgi:aminopeptidase N
VRSERENPNPEGTRDVPLTSHLLHFPLTLITSHFLLFPLTLSAQLAGRWDHANLRHDALRYDIALSIPDSGSRISATVTTRWKLSGPGALVLDLDSEMTVRAATVNGAAARWRRRGDQVELPVRGVAGSQVTTTISYDGVPLEGNGMLLRGSGATRTVFADNWPNRAHLWLASHDHPSDKASVGWSIEAPAGYDVVANGTLERVDTMSPGRVRWHFDNPEAIPVYTIVVGMARMAVTPLTPACAVRCVPVSIWSYPADSAFAVSGPFRRASEIVDFFSQRIAPFPYRELRHVESSTAYGGMENSTAIFYDEKAWREKRTEEPVVAHETMHQWFGDAVTELDWHHVWLSESFATYGSHLWAQHVGGDSALRAGMAAQREEIINSPATEHPILDSTITEKWRLLNTNTYQKGSWLLHSLRGLLGDSAFFRGLTAYFKRYEHRNALSSDFARVMGQAAHQDLSWFFRQGLLQPGYPVLEVNSALAGGRLRLTIRQAQKPAWGLYRMPNLELQLDGRSVTVAVRGRVTRTTIPWMERPLPRSIRVDPRGWWLLTVSGER